jgi:hypothetical protein
MAGQGGIIGEINTDVSSRAESGSGRLGGGQLHNSAAFSVGGGLKTEQILLIGGIAVLGIVVYALVKKA